MLSRAKLALAVKEGIWERHKEEKRDGGERGTLKTVVKGNRILMGMWYWEC